MARALPPGQPVSNSAVRSFPTPGIAADPVSLTTRRSGDIFSFNRSPVPAPWITTAVWIHAQPADWALSTPRNRGVHGPQSILTLTGTSVRMTRPALRHDG